MATAKSTATARKRVEAAVLKRARDGSAFTRCEGCNKNVPVVLIDLHSCSLDSKIRTSLEAQVVEKTVEISKPEKKRKAPSSAAAGKGSKKGKSGAGAKNGKKRPPTAFFIFMKDFRLEFKASHPDEKGVSAVGKAAGVKWKAMTDEEKKPYLDQAKELKAKFDSGEDIAENDVAEEEEENAEAAEEDEEEVEQPEEKKDDEAPAAEEELEKNELDDDI